MSSALLLVDVQANMLEAPAPVPDAEAVGAAIADVLDRARTAGALVIHIRNNGEENDPDAPGTPGWALVHDVRHGEHVVDKHESDAFAGTNLAMLVPPSAPLIVVGMQSEFCVRATSLSALRRGHSVTLVQGAHATYDGSAPAGVTSQRIEEELGAAGVVLLRRAAVTFG